MTPERNLQREEEDRITRALEQAPAVAVPAEFAARVMAQLPERKVARASEWSGMFVRRTHYGRNAMLAGAAVLCCLLVVAAAASRGSGDAAWRIAEWMVLAQLAGIALWWGLAWRTRDWPSGRTRLWRG
jgi:hypothetical protein